MSRHMRVFPSITAILIMLVVISVQLEAAQVQLMWIAPTTDADGTSLTDLAGYRLYYGQTSGNLTQNVNVGDQTAYLLSGLVGDQVYYFTVTAYDTSGNQSTLSNQVSATTPPDPPPPPSTGLVAAYSFNEGSGSLVGDASGNHLTGTISGAIWTNSGKYGRALSFDGTNDRVTVPDSNLLDLTTGMTLMAWVYPTAQGSGVWRNVLIKERSGGEVYNLYSNADTNTPTVYVVLSSTPTNPQGVHGTAQLPLNTWRHLATTYDGSVLRLFVNGNLVGSRSVPGVLLTSSGPLRIGGNNIWGEYFKGRIDEVRVYNKALTASQIQTDMSAPVSPIGSAALVRLAPLANRLHTALRGKASGGRETTIGLSPMDRPASQSLRQRDGTTSSAAQPYLIEAGEVQVTPQWQRVEFTEAFADPIVIANAVSTDAGASALVGIRSVEATGFEIRLQHMTDASGTGISAVAGFLVIERGTYTLADGTIMEAGRVATAASETSFTVPFSRRFNRIPVVMTSVINANEMAPVTSRIQSVMKNDLHVELHEGGSAAHAGDITTLAYIALEPSAGTLQGITFEAQSAHDIAAGQWHALTFLDAFDAPPVLLAEVQGGGSGRSMTLRWDAKRADGVEVTIDAGPQDDDAPDVPAKVGYIALY